MSHPNDPVNLVALEYVYDVRSPHMARNVGGAINTCPERETAKRIVSTAKKTYEDFAEMDMLRQWEIVAACFVRWAATTHGRSRVGQIAQALMDLRETRPCSKETGQPARGRRQR